MSKKSPQHPSLNQAFEELENLVKEFEAGEVDLETGIPKFKRGLELAKYLKTRLTEMENQIEEIKEKDLNPQTAT